MQICEIEPGFYRDCETLMRNLQGRVEVLAYSVHAEGDTQLDLYDDHEESSSTQQLVSTDDDSSALVHLREKMQKQSISAVGTEKPSRSEEVKPNKCSTCNSAIGDAKQYRDHFKSDWHKHNLKRKTRQLPPLTAEECMCDVELEDSRADLKDYSF